MTDSNHTTDFALMNQLLFEGKHKQVKQMTEEALAEGIDVMSVLEDGLIAGMRVVGFTGGSHSWPGHADMLTEAGADTVITRFADLARVAEALMQWEGLPD